LILGVTACNAKGAAPNPGPAATAATVTAIAPSKSAAPTASAPAIASAADTSGDKPLTYAVFGVAANDVLNVRAEPDAASKKVYSYAPDVRGIKGTGKHVEKGNTPWTEVSFSGGSGWVNRSFLVETGVGQGCNDPNLAEAIRAFMRAVSASDGAALKAVSSPLRGLLIRERDDSPTVRYGYSQVDALFTGSAAQQWGTSNGSGEAIVGPFKTVGLPTLRQAVLGKGAQEKCGRLLTGGSAATSAWPKDFDDLTLVSFYYSGEGGAKEWATWAAGMEYVEGKPYVAALVQYHWEI
jgi:hypothetical protein